MTEFFIDECGEVYTVTEYGDYFHEPKQLAEKINALEEDMKKLEDALKYISSAKGYTTDRCKTKQEKITHLSQILDNVIKKAELTLEK